MKAYARVMDGTRVLDVEIKQDLGIKVEHGGNVYTLATDNSNNLILTSIGKQLQIVIKPRAANTVYVEAE